MLPDFKDTSCSALPPSFLTDRLVDWLGALEATKAVPQSAGLQVLKPHQQHHKHTGFAGVPDSVLVHIPEVTSIAAFVADIICTS